MHWWRREHLHKFYNQTTMSSTSVIWDNPRDCINCFKRNHGDFSSPLQTELKTVLFPCELKIWAQISQRRDSSSPWNIFLNKQTNKQTKIPAFKKNIVPYSNGTIPDNFLSDHWGRNDKHHHKWFSSPRLEQHHHEKTPWPRVALCGIVFINMKETSCVYKACDCVSL